MAVRLCGVVALVDDEILGPVVFTSGEVLVKNGLGAGGISLRKALAVIGEPVSEETYLLSINGGTGHVRNHSVASTPWVGGSSERVVTGRGLREPDVTTVSAEVARLERISNILLDDNGAAGSVDEP